MEDYFQAFSFFEFLENSKIFESKENRIADTHALTSDCVNVNIAMIASLLFFPLFLRNKMIQVQQGISKAQLRGQIPPVFIWPTTCFCMTCELRIAFTFFQGLKQKSKEE